MASKYEQARKNLDYTYYTKVYNLNVHDAILDSFLSPTIMPSTHPTLNFTCGAYGAGKSHWIAEHIVTETEVWVNPDALRYQLPNIQSLLHDNPWTVGEKTNLEVGFLNETLIRYCLEQGYTLYADSSMVDFKWFTTFITEIQFCYPHYLVRIYYFEVPWLTILERVWQRAEKTGRCIPLARLRYAFEQVHQAKPVYESLLQENFICI